MAGDRPAVGLAEQPERPIVLADRHAVEEGAHGGWVGLAVADLLEQLAQALQLRAQPVVNIDQVLGGGLLIGRVAALGIRRRSGGPRALVPGRLLGQTHPVVGCGRHIQRAGGRRLRSG
jgi:hypothetical protein